MRGRRPRGPEIVDELPGGEQERVRLKAILQTLTGQMGISAAAQQLGLTPQRVHMLRELVLHAGLQALAPQPLGRPPRATGSEQERLDVLQHENERLRRELAASKLREEVALVLPSRSQPSVGRGASP
jgi:transposase-like protein